jgi:RHH-type proline utilization regulon transcriptional repressor/proline dehydrogenase/delta 1-pyrroline-5-carboxylate dehydrogenase
MSKELLAARDLLHSVKGKPLSIEQRKQASIDLAAFMLTEATRTMTRKEKKIQAQLARMMQDPKGKAFTTSMTDECFRSHRPSRVADQMTFLLKQFGVPAYLSPMKRMQLSAFELLGKRLSHLFVPLATYMLRKETSAVILPGEQAALSAHMHKRRAEGVRLNLNHLGEAILGEEEAHRRLSVYLEDLTRDDIEYISIKISTIFSQINLLAWNETIEKLSERLRKLYRVAMTHSFKRADGTQSPKFVNLDMEEYRDLILTIELFEKILSEPEFYNFSAGIVLQAYLPDSHEMQKRLTAFAQNRVANGGAPIKIRIVKGANLAMEQVESSLRDWAQAPYRTKAEVDANYKRMVTYGCKPEHATAVHLGIASHNLFDIAYAMLLRAENRVEKEVTFEMLEGMADHIRRVVQELAGDMLLYCPVATKEDFQSAVAYLIRRLDENTGPDNFLRHTFGLRPETKTWNEQANLFSHSVDEMHHVSAKPRRTQNRLAAPHMLPTSAHFENESDTDFSLPHNRKWAHDIVAAWKDKTFPSIPCVIDGKEVHQNKPEGEGADPSAPTKILYTYSLASWEDVNHALSIAKSTEDSWAAISVRERCELLAKCAQKLRERRGDLLGVMMADGGKTLFEGDPEISEAIDFADYYLRSMLKMDACKDLNWTPKGTILVTPPWNFPVAIPAGGILAALVAGNCVIFKPAPEAVLTGWILVNALWDAGVPKKVLQFLNCADEPVGSKLIADPRISSVILTGATSTAKLFYRLRPDINLHAETGGKNAIIITALSDRDLAIKDLTHSAFGHSGQKCSAASLAILEAEVYDDPHFLAQLKDAVESLSVGSAWDPSSKVIPLIREPNEALLRGLTTLERGEEWLVQPKQHPTNPNLWSPGVKLGVKQGSFMHRTELFGPVLGIMRAKNLRHALELANDTPYGLTSGLQSLDEREQHIWLRHIEAGNLYINRGTTGAIVRRQPFGGCKASNYGHGAKAGGPNYVAQFTTPRQVFLPQEKHAISPEVNALTELLNKVNLRSEELGVWFASIANYAYWGKHLCIDHDPNKIIGQDNLFRYKPQPHICLRIQAKDNPLDIFRILAAALTCKTALHVSYSRTATPIAINDQWPHHIPLTFTEEDEATFLKRLKAGAFKRVRLASLPDDALIEAASHSATLLDHDQVLATGRFELLHYLREESISIDYHRYGNLGLREAEIRKPVL